MVSESIWPLGLQMRPWGLEWKGRFPKVPWESVVGCGQEAKVSTLVSRPCPVQLSKGLIGVALLG